MNKPEMFQTILTELGRTKFNLSRRWYCSHFIFSGSHIEYVMRKKNRHGNWGQTKIVGLIDNENDNGELLHDYKEVVL